MAGSWKWYVYEIERGGQVVYVGKGCGKRSRASAKAKEGSDRLIACFAHECDAYVFERARIGERLAEGCKLVNVSHGTYLPWHRRTDTRQMAIECIQEIARRIGRWKQAGRIAELAKITRMDISFMEDIHRNWHVG